MRLAKLQINLVLAHILCNYDFEPANGEAAMPVPDRNIARLLIPERPMYVRFKLLATAMTGGDAQRKQPEDLSLVGTVPCRN